MITDFIKCIKTYRSHRLSHNGFIHSTVRRNSKNAFFKSRKQKKKQPKHSFIFFHTIFSIKFQPAPFSFTSFLFVSECLSQRLFAKRTQSHNTNDNNTSNNKLKIKLMTFKIKEMQEKSTHFSATTLYTFDNFLFSLSLFCLFNRTCRC